MGMEHRFRRRPEEVEAWRFQLDTMDTIPNWVPRLHANPSLKAIQLDNNATRFETQKVLEIHHGDETLFVRQGQWIVRDASGRITVYNDEVFESLYVIAGDWYGIQTYTQQKGVPFDFRIDVGDDRCVVTFHEGSPLYRHMTDQLENGRLVNRNSVHALIKNEDGTWYVHSNFYLVYGPSEDEVLEPFRTSLEEDILLLHNASGNDYYTLIKPGVRFDLKILKTKIGTFRLPLRSKVA